MGVEARDDGCAGDAGESRPRARAVGAEMMDGCWYCALLEERRSTC